MLHILNSLSHFYWHNIASPEKQARHLGVTIGKNCLISTRNWTSEGYLITIGNNFQITPYTKEFYERNKKYNVNTKGLGGEDKKKVAVIG